MSVTHPIHNYSVPTYQRAVLFYGVAISGNTVFVANYDAGLLILNVSDLSNPQLLSTYPAGGGFATSIAVSDNTVFIANGECRIIDFKCE